MNAKFLESDVDELLVNDFAGFLDGFQARNMAAIQKTVSLPLSEMRARAGLVKAAVNKFRPGEESSVNGVIEEISCLLNESTLPILQRLEAIGNILIKSTDSLGEILGQNSLIDINIKGLIKAFIEAVESVRDPNLIKIAVAVGEGYKTLFTEGVNSHQSANLEAAVA